jgi:toxin ParE1/3/4
MVDRLTSRSKQIGVFPLSGRVVPEFEVGQIREVVQRPYRIIYHIRPDHVDVIAVLHLSRRM